MRSSLAPALVALALAAALVPAVTAAPADSTAPAPPRAHSIIPT
jgi:hypothetical protein